MMTDPTGRRIRYLRLSLTERCQMRCAYCRPTGPVRRSPNTLTADEIGLLVEHLAEQHGLQKVRITGGDPTARPDLAVIVARIAATGLEDMAMTTNGLDLGRLAPALAGVGLDRVNVSLDSLDRDQFARRTGVDGLTRVILGIDAALAAGLRPLKINTVVMDEPGQPPQDLARLVRFAADRDVEIRFIELMPMGPLADRWAERHVSPDDIRRRLAPTVRDWQLLPRNSGSAQRFRVRLADGRSTTIGLIAPMSCPFCDRCDRLRIAADGSIMPCLMGRPAGSVLTALRPKFNAALLDRLLAEALAVKAPVHASAGPVAMTQIGG